jgi:hypothetical protein
VAAFAAKVAYVSCDAGFRSTAVTLIGLIVAGPGALVDWLAYVSSRQPDGYWDKQPDGYWDNHTLPGATVRLFRENKFVEPVAMLS